MERYTMFVGWKNQYCQTDSSNPYQVTNGIFHRTTENLQISMETHKRPQITKAILRKKKQSWGNQTPWPQTVTALLLSYTPIQNKNLKAVFKKQKEVMLVPGTQHTVFSAMQ